MLKLFEDSLCLMRVLPRAPEVALCERCLSQSVQANSLVMQITEFLKQSERTLVANARFLNSLTMAVSLRQPYPYIG